MDSKGVKIILDVHIAHKLHYAAHHSNKIKSNLLDVAYDFIMQHCFKLTFCRTAHEYIRENRWHPCVTRTQSQLAKLESKATGKTLIEATETMRTPTTKKRLKYHVWIYNKRTKHCINSTKQQPEKSKQMPNALMYIKTNT